MRFARVRRAGGGQARRSPVSNSAAGRCLRREPPARHSLHRGRAEVPNPRASPRVGRMAGAITLAVHSACWPIQDQCDRSPCWSTGPVTMLKRSQRSARPDTGMAAHTYSTIRQADQNHRHALDDRLRVDGGNISACKTSDGGGLSHNDRCDTGSDTLYGKLWHLEKELSVADPLAPTGASSGRHIAWPSAHATERPGWCERRTIGRHDDSAGGRSWDRTHKMGRRNKITRRPRRHGKGPSGQWTSETACHWHG